MKHLLNNLSSEEKNSILEQHKGGMSVDTSRFRQLIESKSGDVKPLINEEEEPLPTTTPPNVSNSESRNQLTKEKEYLEKLKQELEYAKDQLEDEKEYVGGTLLSRIRDYFKVRKLRRQNEKLESQLRLLEKDIQRYKDGKVIGNENGGLIATIGIILTYITGIIALPDLDKY